MGQQETGSVLLAINGVERDIWMHELAKKRQVVLDPAEAGTAPIRYAVVWKQQRGLLASLPDLEVIFSLGAGVDHVLSDPTLPDLPIVRVVSPNLTQYMVEYVTWRVLDHHRQMLTYRNLQANSEWFAPAQPPAPEISVGFMGFGELGRASANAVQSLGFQINTWSRRKAQADGMKCFGGADELDAFLNETDILVVLLPHTPQTTGIINHALLSKLRRDNALGGAFLINAGRGGLQKEVDILRALDDGTLKEASLDVFEIEPLPKASPLWAHPRVFITPHSSAVSDARELVPAMLRQMDQYERDGKLQHLVDRKAGY